MLIFIAVLLAKGTIEQNHYY